MASKQIFPSTTQQKIANKSLIAKKQRKSARFFSKYEWLETWTFDKRSEKQLVNCEQSMGTQICDRSMNRTLFLRTLGIELSRRTLSERNSRDLTRLHTPNHGGHKLLETLGTEEERKEARRMESCYLKLVFQEEEDWVMRMITKHLAANRIIMFKENWRSQKK